MLPIIIYYEIYHEIYIYTCIWLIAVIKNRGLVVKYIYTHSRAEVIYIKKQTNREVINIRIYEQRLLDFVIYVQTNMATA